ncbi:MAG: DUF2934 domain-containing protein [Phycisphaerales bacterium]|nr:MAG: DUF2934 domain-containing protein [Phycisphaerales bacterium]
MKTTKKQTGQSTEGEWAAAASTSTRITQQRIRRRAYEIYRERQRLGLPGDPASDWLRAEKQLRHPESVLES